MKPSVNAKSGNFTMSTSKGKKGGIREREKRKLPPSNDKNEPQSDKGSPLKEGGARKFAGISPESIACYSEQSSYEHLAPELCNELAEDISYKLRYIIHNALIKARLCGRNCISSSDIDHTFENLNLDRVYGATEDPNWITIDQNYQYLDDPVVNLIDLTEQEEEYYQPMQTEILRYWEPEFEEISPTMETYFDTICEGMVSDDEDIRQAVMRDVRNNTYIGPVVEWFYQFAYYLLAKDITYNDLTLSALDMIRALEESVIAPQVVSEDMLTLLVRLILQRLLRSVTAPELLRPMVTVLAILCDRLPIRDFVVSKIADKIPEIKDDFSLSILMIVNELGPKAVHELIIPNLDYFLTRMHQSWDEELVTPLLKTYYIIASERDRIIDDKFYNLFGDSLVPLWKIRHSNEKVEIPETNWRNMTSQLLRTRRKIAHLPKPYQYSSLRNAFPDFERCSVAPKIEFKFCTFLPSVGTQRFVNMCKTRRSANPVNYLTVGKRTTLYGADAFRTNRQCHDHSLNIVL